MGVIIILGIVSLIAIPTIDRQLKEGKKDLSDTQIANIKKSAELWGADNIYNLPDNGDNCYLKYSTLVNSGYADEDLKELSSNTSLTDNNLKITISKDKDYSKYTYTVEFNKDGFTDIPDKYCNARYEYTNLVKNGSFEEKDSFGGYIYGERSTTYSKFGNSSILIRGISSRNESYVHFNDYENDNYLKLIVGHKYYFSIYGYQTTFLEDTTGEAFDFYMDQEDKIIYFYTSFNLLNQMNKWNRYSSIANGMVYGANYNYFGARVDFNNNKQEGTIYYDGYLIVDLTESFGAGKEPSKEWCDKYLDYVEYGSVNYAFYK